MQSTLFRSRGARVLFSLGLCFGFFACLPEGTGTSSSGGGGVVIDSGSGEGGSDSGTGGVSADRIALCAQYAQLTASCCAQGTAGPCATSDAKGLNDICLGYARRCTGMPTCFAGSDCNTLIYCSGSC